MSSARLQERFARLCEIRSPSGEEREIADAVAAELRGLGLEVSEDGCAEQAGAGAGNLLARLPGRSDRWVMFSAHLDTVPHEGRVEVVLADGVFRSAGETILGADDKAAVAVLVELAAAHTGDPPPVGIELLLTVAEEHALRGAKAFDVSALRSEAGFVLDHASPIGEVITASPSYQRLEAGFSGTEAHAGIRPEEGRSAIVAAAHAIAAMRHGRLDEETTANVGWIAGGSPGATNVVPGHCALLAETRSLDAAKAEAVVAEMVDHLHDAANDPAHECDLDVTVERLFEGYRHRPGSPAVAAAERALDACGYTPRHIVSGGGADANAFETAGFHCVCLANGTERNHEPTERVSVSALESMLDVTYALLDAAADG